MAKLVGIASNLACAYRLDQRARYRGCAEQARYKQQTAAEKYGREELIFKLS